MSGGGQNPLHAILGEGNVADILSWKDKKISAAVLIGFTAIWFLFEVVEYHFITLLCHILIILMIILLIWSNGAGLINRRPPSIDKIKLSESTFISLVSKINWFLVKLYDISCGKDLKLFFMVITSLWILSFIGSYVSSLTLLYVVFLCLEILPVFYEQYKGEVNHLASKSNQDAKKLFNTFTSKVLNKIPRGTTKEN